MSSKPVTQRFLLDQRMAACIKRNSFTYSGTCNELCLLSKSVHLRNEEPEREDAWRRHPIPKSESQIIEKSTLDPLFLFGAQERLICEIYQVSNDVLLTGARGSSQD